MPTKKKRDDAKREPRWEVTATRLRHCNGCGVAVKHEIACGMAVTVFCPACLREIADAIEERGAR